MSQFLRPDGQITSTNISAGDWQSIDETSFDDADFIIGTNNSTATYEASLSNPAAPASGTCTVRFRESQGDHDTSPFAPSEGGTAGATVECALYEGTTLIATSGAMNSDASPSFQAHEFTFATSAVTNWNDLRLRFTLTGTGGNPANRRTSAVSWAEVEIPDAPGAELAASVSVVASKTGAITTSIQLNGGVAVQCSVVQADLAAPIILGSAIEVLSSILSATLSTQLRLNAVVAAETIVTGAALATEIKFQTSVQADVVGAAALTTDISLAASCTVVATSESNIPEQAELAGDISCALVSAVDLTTSVQLIAQVSGVVVASADMDFNAALPILTLPGVTDIGQTSVRPRVTITFP